MKFLIIESCAEGSANCDYTQGTRLIEAKSVEEAKAMALDGENGYYPFSVDYDWKSVEEKKRNHKITIYKISKEYEVDLQGYLAECVAKQAATEKAAQNAAERAEYERLKSKFEAIGCSHSS